MRNFQNYFDKGQPGNLCGNKAFHHYSVSWKAWWTFCYSKVLIFGKVGTSMASSGNLCASGVHFVATALSGAGSEFQVCWYPCNLGLKWFVCARQTFFSFIIIQETSKMTSKPFPLSFRYILLSPDLVLCGFKIAENIGISNPKKFGFHVLHA